MGVESPSYLHMPETIDSKESVDFFFRLSETSTKASCFESRVLLSLYQQTRIKPNNTSREGEISTVPNTSARGSDRVCRAAFRLQGDTGPKQRQLV